jgi:GNAT superfamily N-acetyltransferase
VTTPKPLPAAIIERLCGHVHTERFEAGADFEFLDLDLNDYRERFSEGDETVVFVLLAEGSQVVGYAAVIDIVSPRTKERYLAIPAAAVAEQWRGGNAGFRLIAKVFRVGHVRNEAHFKQTGAYRYQGVACVPWTDEVESALRRQGFVPLDDGTFWWVRHYKRRKSS